MDCTPNMTLISVFFDGEEIGRYGSKRYLSECDGNIVLYINIDTRG